MRPAAAVLPEVVAGPEAAAAGLAALRCHGAVVVRGAAPAAALRLVDRELAPHFAATPRSEGPFYGDGTTRFGRVLSRSRTMQELVIDRLVHGLAAAVLEPHRGHAVSFVQAIAVHPGAPVQVPHRDGEMWPVPPGGAEHLVSVMWPLTAFEGRTGATRVWPRGEDGAVSGESVQPVLAPGDALVFLGSTTHAAGANLSDEVRRGVVVGYAASWLVPAENPALAYPPAVARAFPRELSGLLGYRRRAPNLNNYDCRCPSELLDGVAGRGAVDELHPEQVTGLARFYSDMGVAA
jgi:hypothetical protein